MDVLKFGLKFVILPLAMGVIMALGGRIVINAIDGQPLLQEPKHDVALRIEMGDNSKDDKKK